MGNGCMALYRKQLNWHCIYKLQTKLESGPSDGPYEVSIQYDELNTMINERYPGTNTSKFTKEVFPNVIVKWLRVNGIRSTYYIGVRKQLATNTSSLNEQQLLSVSPVTTALPMASILECEIQKILSSNGMVVHGPDSPEHLHDFSIQGLVDELKQLAPTLLDLFVSLGDTKQNSDKH